VSGQLYVPAALLPIPIELETGGLLVWRLWRIKILMPLTFIEHTLFVNSARSLVTVATELSSLSFVAYLLA
jgi:hypothetical protein